MAYIVLDVPLRNYLLILCNRLFCSVKVYCLLWLHLDMDCSVFIGIDLCVNCWFVGVQHKTCCLVMNDGNIMNSRLVLWFA